MGASRVASAGTGWASRASTVVAVARAWLPAAPRLGALALDLRDTAALLAGSFALAFAVILGGLALLQEVAALLPP